MRHLRVNFSDCVLVSLLLLLSGAVWVVAAPKSASDGIAQNAVWGSASNSTRQSSAPFGTPTPTPTPRANQTASVEGLVFDVRTKEPLADVAVTLEGNDDFFETKTGADGRYRFPRVQPSGMNYAWSARIAGYGVRSTYVGSAPEIVIPALGLKLDIPLLRAGVVRGQVRDIAGRPLAGVEVVTYNLQGDDNKSVETNRDGIFERRDLSISARNGGDLYGISARDPRLSLAEVRVRVAPHYAQTNVAQVRLTMKPRAVISGRLRFRGKPLRDSYISVERQDGLRLEEDPSVKVDANGRYSVKVSAPARYKIAFHGEDVVSQEATVDVLPGRLRVVNREFKPFPYGSMAGRIVDERGRGVKDASIELWTENTSETMPVATTDAGGRFFVAKVAPYEKYSVSVDLPRAQKRGAVRIEPVRVRSYRTTRVLARADTIAPRLQVLSVIGSVLKAGRVSFRLRASDNQALDHARLEVDGNWASNEKGSVLHHFNTLKGRGPRRGEGVLNWDSRRVADGAHTLKIVVQDDGGNETSRSFRVQVQGSPFKPRTNTSY